MTVGLLTIYYGNHFHNFVSSKGDEIIYYSVFLLLTNIVMNLILWASGLMDIKRGLLTPLVNWVMAFIVGFIIFITSDIEGKPKQLIFIYGFTFLIIMTTLTILLTMNYKTKKIGA